MNVGDAVIILNCAYGRVLEQPGGILHVMTPAGSVIHGGLVWLTPRPVVTPAEWRMLIDYESMETIPYKGDQKLVAAMGRDRAEKGDAATGTGAVLFGIKLWPIDIALDWDAGRFRISRIEDHIEKVIVVEESQHFVGGLYACPDDNVEDPRRVFPIRRDAIGKEYFYTKESAVAALRDRMETAVDSLREAADRAEKAIGLMLDRHDC